MTTHVHEKMLQYWAEIQKEAAEHIAKQVMFLESAPAEKLTGRSARPPDYMLVHEKLVLQDASDALTVQRSMALKEPLQPGHEIVYVPMAPNCPSVSEARGMAAWLPTNPIVFGLDRSLKAEPICECGAKATGVADRAAGHSSWCPVAK